MKDGRILHSARSLVPVLCYMLNRRVPTGSFEGLYDALTIMATRKS
jgi:hypothetical protein